MEFTFCDAGYPRSMKIVTFNINNVVRRLPNLLAWLRAAEPDVVCLQELKAASGSAISCCSAA
jgi:exonuclease III